MAVIHFRRGDTGRSACQLAHAGQADTDKVTCLRCRETMRFRMASENVTYDEIRRRNRIRDARRTIEQETGRR